MSDTKSIVQKPSQVSLRVEDISQSTTLWPKHKATLDIEPQEERATFQCWCDWLPDQITSQRAKLSEMDDGDDAEEQAFHHLFNLRALWSLMQLPADVVIGARRRLFGAMPPADANGELLFSWYELHLIAAAFWHLAPAREHYAALVRKAEHRAKRAKEVNSIFHNLRQELN